jgi:hypothetical protein
MITMLLTSIYTSGHAVIYNCICYRIHVLFVGSEGTIGTAVAHLEEEDWFFQL